MPVFLSQSIVVSLWFVIPIVKIFPLIRFAFWITSFKTLIVVFHISSGLCSTHPLLGKYCVNSFWEEKTGLPFKSNSIALLDVVPWSIEMMKNISTIKEVSIGHALVCDSIDLGLKETIEKYKKITQQKND